MKVICTKCLVAKSHKEFRPNKAMVLGIDYWCIPCKRHSEAVWRDKHRDSKRKQQRDQYKENAGLVAKKRKLNYSPIKSRARSLARKIPLKPCTVCGGIAERHHPNYRKPLDIIFLCKSHHKMVHDKTLIPT